MQSNKIMESYQKKKLAISRTKHLVQGVRFKWVHYILYSWIFSSTQLLLESVGVQKLHPWSYFMATNNQLERRKDTGFCFSAFNKETMLK